MPFVWLAGILFLLLMVLEISISYWINSGAERKSKRRLFKAKELFFQAWKERFFHKSAM